MGARPSQSLLLSAQKHSVNIDHEDVLYAFTDGLGSNADSATKQNSGQVARY